MVARAVTVLLAAAMPIACVGQTTAERVVDLVERRYGGTRACIERAIAQIDSEELEVAVAIVGNEPLRGEEVSRETLVALRDAQNCG